ncbi:hypothetical protein [Nonomuraea recticatena]|uniref:Uncharacterized protein n=1 Tax=Nonomuraea recticatena TaxID=46178 RepID=A0ABN3TDX3_9ACTN
MPDPIQPQDVPDDLVDAVHAVAMALRLPVHQDAVRVLSAAVLNSERQLLLHELPDGDSADGDLDGDGQAVTTSALGSIRQVRCDECGADTMLAATVHGLNAGGAHVIGGIAVCHECGWSPYSAMRLP